MTAARPAAPLVVVAGGGTAGHVEPALAVAESLVRRGIDRSSIQFVGSSRGLETRLVPERGFAVTLLPGRGVVRGLSMANVAAVGGILIAILRALVLVKRWRPRVVVSVGGYAALPCAIAAALWRIPVVVADSNAVPGAANRIAARWAVAAAMAFDGTGIPNAVVTGTPVRDEVRAVDASPAGRRAARQALGLPVDRFVLVATGGSLGSRRINEATQQLVMQWATRADVAVYHIVGERDWGLLGERTVDLSPGGIHYQRIRYESRMALVYAAADLVVARAGGTTMAELTVIGRPSILVPLPIAPNDHQAAGARRLEAAGACIVIDDRDLTGERLAAEVERLILDHDARDAMAKASAALGRPDAADAVAALIEGIMHR